MTRQISITVLIAVTISCDAEANDGEVNIVRVRNVSLPTPNEVMEAIDADEALAVLDEAYERAGAQ